MRAHGPKHCKRGVFNSVGTWLILLSIVLGGVYYYQVKKDAAYEACQAAYNVSVSKILGIRAQLTASSDRAQTNLILGVAKMMAEEPHQGEQNNAQEEQEDKEFRKLFSTFTVEIARIEQERKENPVPEIPSCALKEKDR